MARRNNTRSRTNTGRQYGTNQWGKPLTVERPPKFIRDRKTVSYDHLPRRVVSNENDGTLSDRVGWVILHPDLVGHVSARLYKIPDALTLVETYRALSRAAPSYALLASYNERVGAPKSEKKYAAQVAQEAYQATIEAAERTIGMLATPRVARALSDLLPHRNQHGSTDRSRYVFWPRRISDYPQRTKTTDEEEGGNDQQDKPETKNGGWGSPLSYDPWQSTPELTTGTEVSEDYDHDSDVYADTDSLPELENLELRSVDELTDEAMDEALEQLQVAASPSAPPPPSPPPPPAADDKKNPTPRIKIRLMRGRGHTRMYGITQHHRVLSIHEGPFPYTITEIEARYHLRWPAATVQQAKRASLIVDDIFARRGDYPTQDLLAIPSHTSYRTALGIDEEEVELWDILNQVSEDDILQQAIEMFDPVKVDSYAVHFIGA